MLPTLDFGFIQLPSFFLVISLVMGLVFYLTVIRAAKLHLDERFSLDLSLVLTLAAMIGARLFHVVFENLDYYRANPERVFYFWQGGFVFYGGFIISFISGVSFLAFKKKMVFFKLYLQLYAPILSISYMIGRIGCFLEGCCYGKFCDLPWSVAGRHPTQIYSSAWELGVFIFLIGYERANQNELQKKPERLFFIWLLLHSVGRGSIEFLRDDFRGSWPLISLSTWISIVMIVIVAGYFYRERASKF